MERHYRCEWNQSTATRTRIGSGSASSDTKPSGSGSTSTPREPSSSSSSSTSSPVPPASTAPANEGSIYPVGTVTAPTGIPQDNDTSNDSSSDTSTTGNWGISLDPIQPTIQPSSGSTDNSNLSATSPVTSSSFFYAAIVLATIGVIGIIVGYRAKQKRSHHDEMRAFRRQSTRTATPANDSSPDSTSDTHSIVTL